MSKKITPEIVAERDGIEHVLFKCNIGRESHGDQNWSHDVLAVVLILEEHDGLFTTRTELVELGRSVVGRKGANGAIAVVVVETGHPVNKSLQRWLRSLVGDSPRPKFEASDGESSRACVTSETVQS